jgi:hypothetical protein
MSIPAAKIRAVCTSSEVVLVRASRKPELEKLDHATVKRLAQRARTLFDKWQDLSRGQSRTQARRTGAGSADANTLLKAQIFRDALTSFETKLAKCEAALESAAKKPKGMTAVEDLLNSKKPAKRKSR